MQHDYLGNPVTCTRADTVKAIDDFIEGFLAYETRAEGIVQGADADADCCLANVYAGLLWMMLEAPDAAERAAPYLKAAEHTLARATEREQMNAAILRAWIAGDMPGAIRVCGEVSDRFTGDLAIVKLQQYFEFNRGNSPAMLRAVLKALDHHPDIAHVHGMASFAYEQCHLLNEAEQAARTALGLKRKEPWAQHALAHVMLTRGRIDEGARFLEGVAGTWTGLNSFMLTHLWWHLALFKLSQGRFADALEIYDQHCWGVAKNYSQDQIGAVSLLARMEIAGIDVGPRWQDLGEHLAARARDTVLPFLTVQYLYGLARARRAEADSLLDTVRSLARAAPGHDREVWREVALPACEGVYAYARGAYASAWRHLSRAMPRLAEIGGSHAQRDLFEQILLDTAIKSGRTVAAQQMLELRRPADPHGVPLNTTLGEVYAELGLTALSREARLRAAATRARHPR
jgi:tetratricopeptide (TPR) repeat protein